MTRLGCTDRRLGGVAPTHLRRAHGVVASVCALVRVDPDLERRPLRSLLDDPRPRRCPTPVGSDAWVQLLGSGGGEHLDEALR
jgi:hypothetical protein